MGDKERLRHYKEKFFGDKILLLIAVISAYFLAFFIWGIGIKLGTLVLIIVGTLMGIAIGVPIFEFFDCLFEIKIYRLILFIQFPIIFTIFLFTKSLAGSGFAVAITIGVWLGFSAYIVKRENNGIVFLIFFAISLLIFYLFRNYIVLII